MRDGDVVERREFHNDLMTPGRTLLSDLLARSRVGGPWIIMVEADGTGALCADNEYVLGEDTDCAISESEDEASASVQLSGSPGVTLVIEGAETVVRDADITIVGTFQWTCGPETSASACEPPALGQAGLFQFTRRTLDTAIPVLDGDRIEVTVEITFS